MKTLLGITIALGAIVLLNMPQPANAWPNYWNLKRAHPGKVCANHSPPCPQQHYYRWD